MTQGTYGKGNSPNELAFVEPDYVKIYNIDLEYDFDAVKARWWWIPEGTLRHMVSWGGQMVRAQTGEVSTRKRRTITPEQEEEIIAAADAAGMVSGVGVPWGVSDHLVRTLFRERGRDFPKKTYERRAAEQRDRREARKVESMSVPPVSIRENRPVAVVPQIIPRRTAFDTVMIADHASGMSPEVMASKYEMPLETVISHVKRLGLADRKFPEARIENNTEAVASQPRQMVVERFVPPDEVIRSDRLAGMSHREMAEKYGVSSPCVTKHLTRLGLVGEGVTQVVIDSGPRKRGRERKVPPDDTILAEHAAGMSPSDMAGRYGVSYVTAVAHFKRLGLYRKHRRAESAQELQVAAPQEEILPMPRPEPVQKKPVKAPLPDIAPAESTLQSVHPAKTSEEADLDFMILAARICTGAKCSPMTAVGIVSAWRAMR